MASRKTALGFAASLLAVATLSGYGTTQALWRATSPVQGAVITNGDMTVKTGPMTMSTLCKDVVKQVDPATTVLQPTESARINQAFTAKAMGENMAADIVLEWTKAPTISPLWRGTYTVVDNTTGRQVLGPTPIGTRAVIADMPANTNRTYTVKFALDSTNPGTTDLMMNALSDEKIDFTGLNISVNQKRSGGGFK